MLRNESKTVLSDAGAALYVVGIDSHWAKRDDAAGALASVPKWAPRIVFMHNPMSFPSIAAGCAPFAVAAHTHGGDIRVPLLPHWSWLELVQGYKVPADGWASDRFGEPGNRLYVNRGIGNSTAPIRINDAPEISIFVMRRAH
jgi:predicted MPP superfamily phosphohydrolase